MIKQTRHIMGMPVTLMTPDEQVAKTSFEETFRFFDYVDQKYSPYIDTSDVCKINRGELDENYYDAELREILTLADNTGRETDGYFNVWYDGKFDPSGIVKGWAIQKAAAIMKRHTDDFYVEAGGDIQVNGSNDDCRPWRVGIRNPFNRDENVMVISLDNHAVATSGTAIRGQHIYDPVGKRALDDIVSLSVIAPTIVDADRMATAAFAMGRRGIEFIQQLKGYEASMIDNDKQATKTTGWEQFEVQPA